MNQRSLELDHVWEFRMGGDERIWKKER